MSEFVNSLSKTIDTAWCVVYGRIIAIVLLYGTTVHMGNIAGLTGTPWMQTPILWRSLDIILLIFNCVTALGLWWKQVWAVALLFGGIILLQWLPYTVWRSQFILQPGDGQTLNGLIGTEAILLGLFALLLWLKK